MSTVPVELTDRLRVAIAAPLEPGLLETLVDLEPRIDVVADLELLPPRRYAADFAGEPSFRRSRRAQAAFDTLLDGADALFGIPDLEPSELARAIRRNPGLRWVHTMAAGGGSQVRAADLTDAELARVAFTTSTGVHGRQLAEFAALGVLAGAKTLPRLISQQKERNWTERWTMKTVAHQTALVLGFGGIGQEVAKLLNALGMRVVVAVRSPRVHPAVDQFVTLDEKHDAAAQASAVIQTLPGTDLTANLLGTEFFAALEAGTTLVSVGRGTVIDEDALLHALDSGRVGFAALDVFAEEPLPSTSRLWTHERVLVSPHTAALSDHEERSIVELFADNARRLLDGEPLRNRVDTVEFY